MGKKDDTMYDYLENRDKFADLVNVVMYQGEQVIQASMLEPEDTRYVRKGRKKNGKLATKNHYRDLKKRLSDGGRIGIIAIENQDAVDYSMPLRIMEYDCMEYRKQVRQIQRDKTNELKKENRVPSDWETKLTEADKINPVQTICLYHGEEMWAGPKSLKDMINWQDAPIKWEEQFHDYGMTLVCANEIKDFSVFRTELGQLLQAIACAGDKAKLQALFQKEEYSHLERETAEAIAIMTDVDIVLNKLDECEENGGYDMCKGMEDWAKEEQEKGAARGKIEGRIEGKIEGKIESKLESIQNLMQNMKITAEEAMNLLGVPVEERAEYLAKL